MTEPQLAPPRRYAPYDRAGGFDRSLGHPSRRDLPFFAARLRELDAAEAFPTDAVARLDALGMPAHYVPARHGGALHSYEDLLQLVRVVARRDLTVAIAHTKTYLGAVSTWVGGTAEQAKELGARVTSGAVVSWGLTERAHGSDLLSGELTATPVAGGYRLDGEKWLINNATRSDLVCVLARTSPAGGTRGYSLLLVDKALLADGSHTCLPAAKTHGIRGADISGIAFDGAVVPATALIGEEGEGIETVLRSLQITRTICAALSLGAGDHALRIATRFGLEHRLYGKRLIDLPQAHRALTEAYADLLAMEAVTLLASRGVHTLTEEMSVSSAAVKYLVPTTADELISAMGQFLGARSFLSEEFAHGLFAKLERDHRIVGIFDGNTLVNLNALINQFAALARGYRAGRTDAEGLAAAATFDAPIPAFDPARLLLTSRTGNSVAASLPRAVAELRELVASGEAPATLLTVAEKLLRISDTTHEQMAAHRPSPRDVPASAFDLAHRYTLCSAAAACLQVWLRNRTTVAADTTATAGLWQDGLWAEAALCRLADRLTPGTLPEDGTDGSAVLDRLMPLLVDQYDSGEMFSLLPFPLAEAADSLAETADSLAEEAS
ncbi:acyl-CoA dehydrogenase family protein [Streptomyces violaceochromogenes]|uniref:Acyl-CoA dehydrogenase family protein n=1 Tax=Streptomyces violaceochromogenes TaxID=67377 RepID=A0ABU6M1P8_9ACTN|nr:acyl-CoA dehydrogenase family protein [Streptomyces violaceochromogenes]MEC7055697.1 acyl-CoA dehydrogenase family protein [Streptomyces violaceochromogenes]GHC74580.1 acyl-CoA dehydrogenase [Streptomyces violaceochromogenes]